MSEQLLSKLPFILTFWTSVLLCWGCVLNFRMFRSLSTPSSPETRKIRGYKSGCTLAANLILLMYLMFEPTLARSVGDAIIVVNVFYTAFLSVASFAVDEWFHVKP